MKLYKELEESIREEQEEMGESKEFCMRFSKLVKNYMDGMRSESEIAQLIEAAAGPGGTNEN